MISPGTIDTPALDPLGPEAKEYFKTLVPRGEVGRPEEIATVALFLASGDSSFVNGVELFVDGGTSQLSRPQDHTALSRSKLAAVHPG